MFYNLQAQEGLLSDNDILSSLEMSESSMEIENVNESPFSLLPRPVQSTMPNQNLPSSTAPLVHPQAFSYGTGSVHVPMKSADSNMAPFANRNVMNMESANCTNVQNLNHVDPNVQEFYTPSQISSFLNEDFFPGHRLSPPQPLHHPHHHQYLNAPSPMHQGGPLPPLSPIKQGGVLPPLSPHHHQGILPPRSPLQQGMAMPGSPHDHSPPGSLEPVYRSRCNTWPRVLQPPSRNLVDMETVEDSEDLDHVSAASPSVSSFTTNSYLPQLSEELPYEDKEIVAGGVNTAGVKSKATRRNPWGNYSYADLITQAIQSSPDKRLTLSQIYDWLINNITYFKDRSDVHNSAGWKNSIRHNLSLHNKFVKINNEGTGKSSWWTLMPDNGGSRPPRRRASSMENSKLKRERERALKGVKARLERSSSTTSNGSSLLDPSSPSPFFRGFEYRQRTNSTASTESSSGHRLQSSYTPPPPTLIPSSPSGGVGYSPAPSMSHSPPSSVLDYPMPTFREGDIQEQDLYSLDLDTLNIQPSNIIREYLHPELDRASKSESVIKEEPSETTESVAVERNGLLSSAERAAMLTSAERASMLTSADRGASLPSKFTHKLTILEPRETALPLKQILQRGGDNTTALRSRPEAFNNTDTGVIKVSNTDSTALKQEEFKQTPVIMYNRSSLYDNNEKQSCTLYGKNGSSANINHVDTGDWIIQRDEDIAEILGLTEENSERDNKRREMINRKIEEMKECLQKSDSESEKKRTNTLLQWLQEMADKQDGIMEQKENQPQESSEVPPELDFSVFEDISPPNSAPSVSNGDGGRGTDMAGTTDVRAVDSNGSNGESSLMDDLSMQHFGQIMCL